MHHGQSRGKPKNEKEQKQERGNNFFAEIWEICIIGLGVWMPLLMSLMSSSVLFQVRDSATEKHVEFAFQDEENPDSESRLHRRDTPHHLKNKRIDSSSSARDVSEEKIHHILANQGGPNCESFESWASELPEPIDVRRVLLPFTTDCTCSLLFLFNCHVT